MPTDDFTLGGYRNLIETFRSNGYAFVDFHNVDPAKSHVILRHDIDFSIKKAVTLAALEAELGVTSTWFVLLRSDMYNTASASSVASLRGGWNRMA